MHRYRLNLRLALSLAIVQIIVTNAAIVPRVLADWPQLLGANRDSRALNETLADWKLAPPKIIWSADSGAGYAGVAIANNRVLLSHRRGETELLTCFDAANGNVFWEGKFPTSYQATFDPDNGPRCVPTIHRDVVILYGAGGDLRCVELNSGKVRWHSPIRETLQAPDGYFGAGSSPLVIDNKVIVCAGGRLGGVAALSIDEGSLLWKTEPSEASYSSPVVVQAKDEARLLCVMRLEAWLIKPSDGSIVARTKFGARGPTVNAATPLIVGTQSFLTSSYGIGATVLDWDAAKSTPRGLWANDSSLSSQYITPVITETHVFGIHGREDQGPGALRCVQWSDGKVLWSEENFGIAHVIATSKDLLAVTTEGTLRRFAANPRSYQETGMFQLPKAGKYRSLPALSNGLLFTRSTDSNGGSLIAIRVGTSS